LARAQRNEDEKRGGNKTTKDARVGKRTGARKAAKGTRPVGAIGGTLK